MKIDENNFSFELDDCLYVMEGGKLTVDDCIYEENLNDPTYSLVCAVWRSLPGKKEEVTGDDKLMRLIHEANARFEALSPEEQVNLLYEQKRSFVRGMCPSKRDLKEWSNMVDKLLPPRGIMAK